MPLAMELSSSLRLEAVIVGALVGDESGLLWFFYSNKCVMELWDEMKHQ